MSLTVIALDENERSRDAPPGGKSVARSRSHLAVPSYAVGLAAALISFYVAKSIASGGRVAIDQIGVWLLASLPLVIFEGFERFYSWRADRSTNRLARSSWLVVSWTISRCYLLE